MFVQNLWHFIKAVYFLFLAGARRRTRTVIGTIQFVAHFICETLVALSAWIILGDRGLTAILLFTWFREVHDVFEGYTSPPPNETLSTYGLRSEMVMHQVTVGSADFYCMHPEDRLLKLAVILAKRRRLTIGPLIRRGWEYVIFDAERWRRKRNADRRALDTQAKEQDEAFLELFITTLGGNMANWSGVRENIKGVFTRSQWLLERRPDLDRRLINVPATELGKAGSLLMWQQQEQTRILADVITLKAVFKGAFATLFPQEKERGLVGTYFLAKVLDHILFTRQEKRLARFRKRMENHIQKEEEYKKRVESFEREEKELHAKLKQRDPV